MSVYPSSEMLSSRGAIVADIICAIIIYFIYKTQDLAVATFSGTLLLLGVAPCFPAYLLRPHFSSFLVTISISFGIFYGALLSSITACRLSPFHPLAKYPSPLFAKLSKLWGAYVMSQGKSHVYLKELHAKHGPYARIGPNELSVTEANAIPDIFGANGMPKGPLWDARRGPGSHGTGLSLVDELSKMSSSKQRNSLISVNLAEWIGYFSFGGGFEMMQDGGDKTGFCAAGESSARIGAKLQHLTWASALIRRLPLVTNRTKFRRKFGWDAVRKRKENGSSVKDLYYYRLDEAGVEKEPMSDQETLSNGSLTIGAGSNTTSTVLSELFFFLLSHPAYYESLQAEVDTVFPPDEGHPFDASKLAKNMPFLDAVINETLRLRPPPLSDLQRAPGKGSGGKWIGNNFFPEGTAVIVPPYAMHRDPRYFSPFPDEFMPERWLHIGTNSLSVQGGEEASVQTHDSGIIFKTESSAFIPFSYGPANCVGRNFALLEMRMVVVTLMQRFGIRFAPGYDSREWDEKLQNLVLMIMGPLPVVLTTRF